MFVCPKQLHDKFFQYSHILVRKNALGPINGVKTTVKKRIKNDMKCSYIIALWFCLRVFTMHNRIMCFSMDMSGSLASAFVAEGSGDAGLSAVRAVPDRRQ